MEPERIPVEPRKDRETFLPAPESPTAPEPSTAPVEQEQHDD